MMDAWETLIAGSTIDTGDAWEHLITQGGTGTVDYVVLADGLELEVETMEFDTFISTEEFVLEIEDNDFDVEIYETEYTLEIC